MMIRVELEMLAVLLFLTPVVIDGMVLTKCQLVKDLQAAVPTTMPERDTVIAKLVYQAETVANFSTNFTIQVSPPMDNVKSRIARSAKKSSPKAVFKPPNKAPTKAPAKTTTKAPPNITQPAVASPPNITQSSKLQNTTARILNMTQMAPMINHTTHQPSNDSQKWMLYSLFLIPDAIACTAPNVSSFNVCNTTCSALLNNDITLATTCMLTIFNPQSNNNPEPDQGGADNIMQDLFNKFMQSYPNLNSTTYLAECSKQ